MIDRIKHARLGSLGGFLAASASVAIAGAIATSSSVDSWYQTLERPKWTPPAKLFAPVWTALYILMSISAWLVTGAAQNRPELRAPARLATGAWFSQLLLNLAWSCVFFGARRIGASLFVIGGLWGAILTYIVWTARVSRLAAWLFAPYFAWVSFASALNLQLWRMNRGTLPRISREM